MTTALNLFRSALLVAAALAALQSCRHQPTAEERLESFIQQQEKAHGHAIFRTTVEGKPLVLLLKSCSVYRLEATPEAVTEHEVLKPGFLLWPTGCTGQRLWRDGAYIFAELINMEFGAGGGNASGGTYRSRNGIDWEKQTGKGWLAVAEAQR